MVSRSIDLGADLFDDQAAPLSRIPGLAGLVGMELRKLAKRPMSWIILALLLGANATYFFAGYFVANAQGKLDDAASSLFPPGSFSNLTQIPAALGLICMAVLAAGLVGSEYGWGTMRTVIATGVPRGRLLTAKVLALVVAALAWLLIGGLFGLASSVIVNRLSGRPLDFGTMDAAWWGDVGLMIGRTSFVLMVPLVFGFAAAVIGRSLAAGIAVPVIWQVFETIFLNFAGYMGHLGSVLQDLTIVTNTEALLGHNAIGPVTQRPDAPTQTHAMFVLTGYLVLLLAASFVTYRRRDMTSGA